jgi:hypothetical protein
MVGTCGSKGNIKASETISGTKLKLNDYQKSMRYDCVDVLTWRMAWNCVETGCVAGLMCRFIDVPMIAIHSPEF